MMRIGHGFDVHAFGEGDAVILGGVRIPYEKGLVAHSDGDVLLHALCDALLGAAGLGDIGKCFPDTDDAYKGINSRELLRHVVTQLASKGYVVGNADITLIAQAPKVSAHTKVMEQYIADDLNISADCVNIKATTTEKLGFV
ncbi:MAG: 2-C-methyl-D-erythritol 2,4-cyclodiphosphate synthase, partial [Cellvibrionales bacterium]|nr:2-C-methyl-D-erythritol 2,4-cyclodiphosphate synthase [Cellvibrionales bacterium]